jgi:hypothetical protein
MKNKTTIITIVLIILVGGGGFFAGMQYQKSKTPQFAAGGANGRRGGQAFGNRAGASANGARPVAGQIVSEDSTSITVKSADGSTKIVILSTSTGVTESTTSTKQALTNGQQVLVIGTPNSDGSITAQNIQINPQQMMRFGNGGNGNAPAQ